MVKTPAFASNQAEFGLYEVTIRPPPFPYKPSTVTTMAIVLTMQDKGPPVYPSQLTRQLRQTSTAIHDQPPAFCNSIYLLVATWKDAGTVAA
jgi:hypothetical protein